MAVETSGKQGWGSVSDAQEVVFDNKDVADFLVEVTHELIRGIDGDHRGISWALTLFGHGVSRLLAAGSETARAADREQSSFEDGPLQEALHSGDFVHLADVGQDRRWPGYASAAADHGVRSLLAVPILAAAGSGAAVNLYASTAHAFTSADIVRTRAYAAEAARALRVVLRVAERAEVSAELAVAQSSMILMDLAVSTLMTDYGLGREAALQYLRTARQSNQGLREAALNVMASRLQPADSGHKNLLLGLSPGESAPLTEGPYRTGSTA